MSKKELSTDPYKGVRDFYPEDMAVERYIFDVWSKTAESFGFLRYDASILEPSELYKSKGAENEEMVNEQTYTFTDRGDREVTLRPEMTPTVARMVAGRRRELTFPVRWYSIPNLFRYERMQKGRLREHYQLNCDIFGVDDYTMDVEIISLAHQMILNFGATPEMFEIRLNNKTLAIETIKKLAEREGSFIDGEQIKKVIRLMDREKKMSKDEYFIAMATITNKEIAHVLAYPTEDEIHELMKNVPSFKNLVSVGLGLKELGIKTTLDMNLVRGFDYYTGTIFEMFDVSGENNRSMLGGGRYDNLTELFGGEPITGIGFGMGDVTMRDFLETHKLLKGITTAPKLMILPVAVEQNMPAQKIAHEVRTQGVSVSVDASTKKIGKKIADAGKAGAQFILVVGADEVIKKQYTIKNLDNGEEKSGTLAELIFHLGV